MGDVGRVLVRVRGPHGQVVQVERRLPVAERGRRLVGPARSRRPRRPRSSATAARPVAGRGRRSSRSPRRGTPRGSRRSSSCACPAGSPGRAAAARRRTASAGPGWRPADRTRAAVRQTARTLVGVAGVQRGCTPAAGWPRAGSGTNSAGGAVMSATPLPTSSGASSMKSRQWRSTSRAMEPGVEQHAAEHDRADRVQPQHELGHDPEVAPAAADRPEQVRVLLLPTPSRPRPPPVTTVADEQAVAREPELALEPPAPAAQGEPADAGGGHPAAGHGQSVLLGGRVHRAPAGAAADPERRGPRRRPRRGRSRAGRGTPPPSMTAAPVTLCPPPYTVTSASRPPPPAGAPPRHPRRRGSCITRSGLRSIRPLKTLRASSYRSLDGSRTTPLKSDMDRPPSEVGGPEVSPGSRLSTRTRESNKARAATDRRRCPISGRPARSGRVRACEPGGDSGSRSGCGAAW